MTALENACTTSSRRIEPVTVELGAEVFVYHRGHLTSYKHRERDERVEAQQRRERDE